MESEYISPLTAHLEDLRTTLIRTFVVIGVSMGIALLAYRWVVQLLLLPLPTEQTELVILGPVEGLGIVLRCCFWFGTIASSPLWLFFLYQFIGPGLHSHERRLVLPFMLTLGCFLVAGGLFAYGISLPLANTYLYNFNMTIGKNFWSLSHYLDYSIFFVLASGLAAELGAVLLLLVHLGWLQAEQLQAKRHYIVLCIFLLAALLTPPDVITQLLIALPLWGLFELTVLYARYRARDQKVGEANL